jgi:glycosyltransferase involved in cell wall biosynthesis
VKIQHLDTAHLLFHNAGEASALLALQQRRGVTLRDGRTERPNLGLEHADAATMLGNTFTMQTYRYAHKPGYPLPVTSAVLYPSPETKDFARCANRFLWLGSGGLVFKGLDLVLEAFAQMPDHHLTICGPIQHEPHFEQAYYRELYQTPNIHTVGWMNVGSSEFVALASQCAGLISASCSEGQSGSVITGLHAGLIPIISYECGVDVHQFGRLLRERTMRGVQEAVWRVSHLPTAQLRQMALSAWQAARTYYTRPCFAEAYRKAIERILASPPVQMRPPLRYNVFTHCWEGLKTLLTLPITPDLVRVEQTPVNSLPSSVCA